MAKQKNCGRDLSAARAHQALDRAMDRCYGSQAFNSELARLGFLFGLYQQLSAPVLGAGPKAPRRRAE